MKRIMLFTVLSIIAIAAYALQISEFIVTPTGSEAVEIHNEAGTTLDITGYKIVLQGSADSDTGTFAAYTMAAGEYKSYSRSTLTTLTLSNDGMIIKLLDNGGTVIDSIGYGNMGEGPAPIYNFSTARVASTGNVANDWNMDTTPTMGSANDAPAATLGTGSVFFNEVFPSDTFDSNSTVLEYIELYNNSASPVDIANWFIVCDDDYYFPGGSTIPANGYLVVYDSTIYNSGATFFYLEQKENLYLYNAVGQRIDQFGFTDIPDDSAFAVIPNGVRNVFNGFSSATSTDFMVYYKTPGAVNPVETFSRPANENDFRVFSIHGTGIGIENLNNVSGNISITDVTGRVLYTSFLKNMTFVTKSGIYFVHISTEAGSSVTKTAVIR